MKQHTTAALIDAASERDKRYFARHPGVTVYVRRRLPGEFGLLEDSPDMRLATHVEVTKVSPNTRMRCPIWLIRHGDYPNGVLPLEHVEAAMDYAINRGGAWRFVGDDEVDDSDDDDGPRAS